MKIDKLGRALFLAVQGKNEQEKQRMVKNLVEILAKRKRTFFLLRVLKDFKKYSRESEVVLTLSREMDKEFMESVKNELKKVFNDNSVFKVEVDRNIVSGFTAKSNNYLVDASIKGLFGKLKRTSAN